MQDPLQDKVIEIKTKDSDQDNVEHEIKDQEIETTGGQSINEDQEEKITGVENMKEVGESTGER